ncbi:MAG TPA: hypothetical protein PK637_06545 [Flavobacteriales bacterium]|nr:hypothetical protein [Flavobacteriales bacterium]HRE96406.1 hypothetical protein [Flavobacteriales bacterium]HRJ34460.1 hypothetical protein [Flavobacteriales bacterium]HRJ37541.1 hypothetical protein [Flavobacteriales bacterium]
MLWRRWMFFVLVTMPFLLSACYCEKVTYGRYDVRFLNTYKEKTYCYPGFTESATFFVMPYVGVLDQSHIFQVHRMYPGEEILALHSQSSPQIGLRMGFFPRVFFLPGPFLKLGCDISYTETELSVPRLIDHLPFDHQAQLFQYRILLHAQLATWVKPRFMGSITTQYGVNFADEQYQLKKSFSSSVEQSGRKLHVLQNMRLGYAFNFGLRKGLAFSMEVGIGAGTFLRSGLMFYF